LQLHLVGLIQRGRDKKERRDYIVQNSVKRSEVEKPDKSRVIQFCNLCQYTAWQAGLINDIGGDASSMETEIFTNHEYLYLFHTLLILYP